MWRVRLDTHVRRDLVAKQIELTFAPLRVTLVGSVIEHRAAAVQREVSKARSLHSLIPTPWAGLRRV